MSITIKEEKVLYTIEEMLDNSELKKKLLENNRETDSFIDTSIEDSAYEEKRRLKRMGFSGVDIHYDLSYCQGSGACFDFDSVKIPRLIKYYPDLNKAYQPIKWIFKLKDTKDIYSSINSYGYHYCHEKTRDVEIEDWLESIANFLNGYDISREVTTNLFGKIGIFQKELVNTYLTICYEIKSQLYKDLEYYTSDDFLIEDLKAQFPLGLFTKEGILYTDDKYSIEEKLRQEEFAERDNAQTAKIVQEFIDSKEAYIVTNSYNEILVKVDNRPVMGEATKDNASKAIIFSSVQEAKDFIIHDLFNLNIDQIEKVIKNEGEE